MGVLSGTVERSSLESTFPFSKVSLQGLRASAPRTYTLQARDTDSPNRGRTTIAALPPRRPASYTRYNTGLQSAFIVSVRCRQRQQVVEVDVNDASRRLRRKAFRDGDELSRRHNSFCGLQPLRPLMCEKILTREFR